MSNPVAHPSGPTPTSRPAAGAANPDTPARHSAPAARAPGIRVALENYARKGRQLEPHNLLSDTMTVNLLKKFWADEEGGVLATEYLMLGTIVAVGGTSGLVAMRDSMNSEFKEFGESVHEVRQANMPAQYRHATGEQGNEQQPVSGNVRYVPLTGATMVP